MKRYTSSTAMIGILAALTVSALLTSAMAFAQTAGQQPDTKGCCEKGQCDPTTKVVPAVTPPAVVVPASTGPGTSTKIDPLPK